MAKTRSVYFCRECGYESSKWVGKCPACGEWNSFSEEKVTISKKGDSKKYAKESLPVKISEIEISQEARINMPSQELNRVLGGGLVKGSLILIGGEPGIGKSTLILQLCDKVKGEGTVLYVSGEESAEQIKLRADRLRN